MKAEIITVGTELVTGQVLDTHSSYLSKQCRQLNIPVMYHTTVGDQREEMLSTFRLAASRSDLVIICGGLGPTWDDMSKEVLAESLGYTLVQDSGLVVLLERRFAARQIELTENNYRQTYVFPNGTIFPNPNGTAPGHLVEQDGTTYILLPGPPRELLPMFEDAVFPYLKQRFVPNEVIESQDLCFFGIGESKLEAEVQRLINQNEKLVAATYVSDAEVTLRLISHAKEKEQAQSQLEQTKLTILSHLGEYCFSEGKNRLEEVVVNALKMNGKTVAFAESCTGGLLAHLISSVPGSSAVLQGGFVLYTYQAKEAFLHVTPDWLAKEGAVSYSTAKRLAEEARDQFHSDYALSVTGVAGPEKSEDKPVGLVYVGLASQDDHTQVYQLKLQGMRQHIQLMAAKHALFNLQQRMKER
ncbi:competence/damage-inducible protein cinA [Seinonella peptonophila]|uniref:Putative competence-damage inducible protein n=1 Tax=Seinonella peptonophila TaxID=112248 RepID=A0A1M4TBD1_9BACL|nr:competence/damage-inducible protein A [Seinonella peptonophila]SHE41537.1 competence/damage-inducible protein cinA [Seinonella peptonophila]